MKYLAIVCFSTLAISVMGQQQHINPRAVGYSDAVVVSQGKTIFVSGQVPTNAKGELIGKGDLRAQTLQVFENVKHVLAQADATLEHVAKMNTYIVACKPTDVAIFREVRKQFFSANEPPANTLVGVTSLVDPDFLIEIEVVAVIK